LLLYRLLLVPEALLIGLVLLAHELLGRPLWTAVLGTLIVAGFGVRLGLLMGARAALAQAAYPLAERLVRVALALHPCSADAWSLRGSVALNRGDSALAVEALARAQRYLPGQAALHAALSGALLDQEQAGEARSEALRALALDPQQPTALLHLASIERVLGAPAETSARLIARGLEQRAGPQFEAPLRCLLAELQIEASPEEARAELRRVEELLAHCNIPQRAALHCHLGALLRQFGHAEEARAHFVAAEQLDPHGRYANIAWRSARV
jgi:tetratricopeptide (TPR) repeat protein